MLEHVGAAKQSCPDPAVMVEQRVDFSRWVRQGFGTADALIIADGTLHIIDLKYGSGIEVSAEDNPQLKCYGLGALDQFGDLYDIDEVRLTIYQPRRQNVSEWRLPASDLLVWADTLLKPAADLTWDGKGRLRLPPVFSNRGEIGRQISYFQTSGKSTNYFCLSDSLQKTKR